MNKKSSTNKSGKKYEYYICSTYRKKSNKLCTKHSVKQENLEKAVLEAINLHIDSLIDIEEILEQINKSEFQNIKNENIEKMITAKQNEISKISNFKMKLYEDWKNEDITREEYIEYKQKYENDIERLKQNIERLQNEKEKYENQNVSGNEWIKKFKEQKDLTELSRDIIIELIDCIYVHENGDITIKFKFEDEFKRIREYIENNKNVLEIKSQAVQCVVKNTQGGGVAAPIGSQVLGEVLPYLEIKKDNEQEEEKKEVEVPNIIGMTEKEAKKALEDVGLQLEFKKSEEKETITDQLPKAGIKTKSGTIIIAQQGRPFLGEKYCNVF